MLAASFGRALRPVVKSIPVEVLISAEEAIIPGSDALLRPGNKVALEGRLNPATFRLPRAAREDATVQTALERTRTQFETRNADLTQRAEAARQQRQATQERAQREGRPSQTPSARQQPLSGDALERQIARAQQRLLTNRRVRVEVGYVELLQGTPASSEERARLIAEAGERRRTPPARREAAAPPDRAALLAAQDRDAVQAMRATEKRGAAVVDHPAGAGDHATGDHAEAIDDHAAADHAEAIGDHAAADHAEGARDEAVGDDPAHGGDAAAMDHAEAGDDDPRAAQPGPVRPRRARSRLHASSDEPDPGVADMPDDEVLSA
ncbi:hypothetical protein A9Q02_22725 [Candidatus Chloroploca asiatica]|uniref:Uncharacterized protein n=1 Tax=Candidatus Chloroploca asiatica TaxID=1506545 RepID=A0A2H3L024_9CHLR|nr:hypothetical protein A9Q02_22725 [Candidatus Chloroploca asiatica]